jgi:hypothetical protein
MAKLNNAQNQQEVDEDLKVLSKLIQSNIRDVVNLARDVKKVLQHKEG